MSPASRKRTGLFVLFFVAVAFFMRTWFAWDAVLGGSFVRFTESDAWYHLRLTENLLHNFPSPLTYDPYLKFPGGQQVSVAPGLDWLVAIVSLALGGGSPSTAVVERVAAVMPAIFGALTVLPVYSLGRRLSGPLAGLFAAALSALMPGLFLQRTTLGFADHHAAEIFFSTLTLALVVRAIDGGSRRVPWAWAAAAGLALAAYLCMWSGGALLVFALAVTMCSRLILSHLRGDPVDWPQSATFVIVAGTALVVVLILVGRFAFVRYHAAALIAAIVFAAGLTALSRALAKTGMPPRLFLLSGAAAAIGIVAAGVFLSPATGIALMLQIARFMQPTVVQVSEAAPLLQAVPWWPFWLAESFGLALPLALVALVPVARSIVWERRHDRLWVAIWFLVACTAMVGQVRFAYYVAVPVALFAGFACDRALARFSNRQEWAFLGVLVLVFLPLAQLARAHAVPRLGPPDDWHETMQWMRVNTPEPFGSPAVYLDHYAGFSEANPYPEGPSAYGVLSWWEAGHWIVRIARRPVNTNPTQNSVDEAAGFFLTTTETEARAHLDRLGTRYVIASRDLPAIAEPIGDGIEGQLRGILHAAGADATRFYEFYRDETAGAPSRLRILYYPDYYRTMATRLYVYAGQAVEPRGSTYIAVYSEQLGTRRALRELRLAASFEDAQRQVSASGGHARIVGVNPFETCVPLEPVASLSLVHRSPGNDARRRPPANPPAQVQVYEYRARQ